LSLVFDSEPLIAYFIGEPSAFKVVELLRKKSDGELNAYINLVNISEIYYIVHRIDPSRVEDKIDYLRNNGIQFIPVLDNDIWKTAAQIKSQYRMSLADAYAAATAIQTESTLVIGRDKEFSGLQIEKIVLA
jgi:predicted nucleic acid-binding protein